jgi:phosphomannomutase
MAMSGKGLRVLLEETMEEIGYFYYARIDLQIDNLAKEKLVERLCACGIWNIAGFPVASHNFSDGFKYIFEDGSWLLIRPSGTEPVLRLYSEAGDQARVTLLLEAARSIAGV